VLTLSIFFCVFCAFFRVFGRLVNMTVKCVPFGLTAGCLAGAVAERREGWE
jgi:hypothetical protein